MSCFPVSGAFDYFFLCHKFARACLPGCILAPTRALILSEFLMFCLVRAMGCFQSSEAGGAKASADKYKANPASTRGDPTPAASTRGPSHRGQPDPTKPTLDEALQELYEPVHQLGAGGTGESWLAKDRESGEYLAVKLIKRPIPSVLQPMMLREIEVGFNPPPPPPPPRARPNPTQLPSRSCFHTQRGTVWRRCLFFLADGAMRLD